MGFLVMALAFSSLVTADNSLGTAAKNAGTTGIYPVGWDTETLPRTGGDNFTALVIYPATANGNNNDLAIISARSDADGLTRQLAYLISRR